MRKSIASHYCALFLLFAAIIFSGCPQMDQTPPAVTSTSPVMGATAIAVNTTMAYLTLSEPLDSNSFNESLISIAPALSHSSALSSDGTRINISFTTTLAPLTNYTITIAPGLRDRSGNALVGTTSDGRYLLSFTSGSIPDRTPPTLVLTTPLANATNVESRSTISLTFSESIDPRSVTSDSFRVDDLNSSQTLNGAISCTATTCQFAPYIGLYPLHRYRVTVSDGILDLAGNALANPTSLTFTTKDRAWTTPQTTPNSALSFTRSMNARGDLLEVAADSANSVYSVQFTDGSSALTSTLANITAPSAGILSVQAVHLSNRGTRIIVVGSLVQMGSGTGSTTWQTTYTAFVQDVGMGQISEPFTLGQVNGAHPPSYGNLAVATDDLDNVFVAWIGDASTGNSLRVSIRPAETRTWSSLPQAIIDNSYYLPILLPVSGGGMRFLTANVTSGSQLSFVERTYLPAGGWLPTRSAAPTGYYTSALGAVSPQGNAYLLLAHSTTASTSGPFIPVLSRLDRTGSAWVQQSVVSTPTAGGMTFRRLSVNASESATFTFDYLSAGTYLHQAGVYSWPSGTGYLTSDTYGGYTSTCYDDQGRLSVLIPTPLGTPNQFTHYRTMGPGSLYQQVRTITFGPSGSSMTPTTIALVCNNQGRMKFFASFPGPLTQVAEFY